MLPGIIYPNATCSQALTSEARAKTARKQQRWGNKPRASTSSAHALSHHALLVLGCKKGLEARAYCSCTLSPKKPQQRSPSSSPWASQGAGLLLTHMVPDACFSKLHPPCAEADPRLVTWPVDDVLVGCYPPRVTQHLLGAWLGEWNMGWF